MKKLSNYLAGAKQRYATRKAKGTILSLLLTTCAVFTACTDEVESISQQNRATLQLNVGVNQPTSRAIVEGKTLPNTAQIGVSVVDATGTAYQQQNYNNVLYTAAEVEGKQTWSTTANVTLSGEEATLYAYYPYAEGADITAIPVDMTETDQKDWMYATPVTGLSDGKSTAEVKLNHALTDLRLTFYKENYSGKGEVTDFTIQSTGIAVGGTLNAKTGEIILPATPVNTITRTAAFTLTDKASATPIDVMLIPTGTEAPVNVSVTVDGHTYSASTTAFTLQKAKAYNYVMKLSSTGLEVTSVALTDWNEKNLGDATFEPEQPEDYSTWVKATYNVVTTSSATDLLGFSNMALVSEMAVLENGGSRAVAEPVVVTSANTYQFATTGMHTVYVKFVDMTKIPDYAFARCNELTEVTIPNSVQTIGKWAFLESSKLKKATFGSGIKTIEIGAFQACKQLIAVKLGSNVETIENQAFKDCMGMIELELGIGLKTIGQAAFNRCYKLSGALVIPEGVTHIGESAFSRCERLTEIIIGSGVKTIGANTFSGCTGLTSVTFSNLLQTIGDRAFQECKGLTGTLVIPETVISIGEAAFDGCNGLTEISIPQSVTSIRWHAFGECSGLGSIVVDASNTVYDSRNNCNAIMETATNTLIRGCKNTVVPQNCEAIKDYAFDNCEELTEVTIPNSVTTIGERAFQECWELKDVTIGSGVTSIGDEAFSGCNKLNKITSLATTAPSVQSCTFSNIKSNGTLYVLEGATGYDTWIQTGNTNNYEIYLGNYNWTLQEITE